MDNGLEPLWKTVAEIPRGDLSGLHGLGHWRRVARNGALLATRTGADPQVVELFAIFHDAKRENDDYDPEHGLRGARLAARLRGILYQLDDAPFRLLLEACECHADGEIHDDPTIGTCWDADRLDLGRVGLPPSEVYMSTAFGKQLAREGTLYNYV